MRERNISYMSFLRNNVTTYRAEDRKFRLLCKKEYNKSHIMILFSFTDEKAHGDKQRQGFGNYNRQPNPVYA